MEPGTPGAGKNPLAALQRLARGAAPALEICELCGKAVGPKHRHLLATSDFRIICACDPCALCFQGVVGGRFKLIPRDTRPLPGFQLTESEWAGLSLPINLAFFFYHGANRAVKALYPSPAGATESLLSFEDWAGLVQRNPMLAGMEPDVEALLVNRIGARRQYYLAPIDKCYELVGLIRMHWRGLSGGTEVWKEIDRFFNELNPVSKSSEAPPDRAGGLQATALAGPGTELHNGEAGYA